MRVAISSEHTALGDYIPRFIGIVGKERWFKRVDQLDTEQQKSPFQWKIVKDYHWLEMAISFQSDVLAKEGHLRSELTDALILAALNFAATTVEVHARLSRVGQRSLEGQLHNGLKAETGYASLYLELDLAQRLMDAGYDVNFADLEATAQFDLLFSRGMFTGEVECKSLSTDAGRQIHRKDFYRFMEALSPALKAQRALHQPEVLLITLDGRLSSSISDQAALRAATRTMLEDRTQTILAGHGFEMERRDFNAAHFGAPISDTKAFYSACSATFGPNPHVAAGLTEDAGCLVGSRASSTVFSQLLPFVALTRSWGVCFRSQRLRLPRLMGEFSDGFFTVVADSAMLYWLRNLLASTIQSLRYQRLIASTCPRSSLHIPHFDPLRLGWNPELDEQVLKCCIEPADRSVFTESHFPAQPWSCS